MITRFTKQEQQNVTIYKDLKQEPKISNNHFFPFCVNEWYKLDTSLRKAEIIKRLKYMLKDFFNLKQKSLFAIHDPTGVKLLSKLRLKFSHLNEHKLPS